MSSDAVLKQAAALIQEARHVEAAALCRRVLATSPRHADALHLLATATWKAGDRAAAEAHFRDALRAMPGHPAVLVSFGDFLRAEGRVAEAESALRQATKRAPRFAPGWYRLALLLHAGGRFDDAADCPTRATVLAPRFAPAWELLAAAEQKRSRLDAAAAACREGLRHSPDAPRLHYAQAQVLRQACRFGEAGAAYEAARRHGFEATDLYRNGAEAWLEAGEAERALAVLDEGIRRHPDDALLHRLQARLRWELGAPGDALAPLRQATATQPGNPALWETLADLLNRLGRKDEALAAAAEARAHGCPDTPGLAVHEAVACAGTGAHEEATRIFERLVAAHPGHAGVNLAFAGHLLSTGEPGRAESLCADVLRGNPHAQLAWAYRGAAWELLGDPRAAWLLDYARMVIPMCVEPPAGYVDAASFFAEVRTVLESLHRSRAHPIEQTVRGGTQTNGYLFRHPEPALRQLEAQIRAAIGHALGTFPHEPEHPFWGRRPGRDDAFRFSGAWSVRLSSQGFHTNHVHPEGWISSALYVALPDEVRAGADRAGHIQFGVPMAELGLALPPRRVVAPEVGMLVLFPSYMWHGTVPFTSAVPRITVAFDVQPLG